MCGREVHLQQVSGDFVTGAFGSLGLIAYRVYRGFGTNHRMFERNAENQDNKGRADAHGSRESGLLAVFLQHRPVPGSIASLVAIFEHVLFLYNTHSITELVYWHWAWRLRVWGQAIRQGTSFHLAEAHRARCQFRDLCSDSEFRAWSVAVSVLS